MSADGEELIRRRLLPKFDGVRKQGGYWMVRCPAHDDGQASLSISAGDTQPVVLNCHAGCRTADILAAIGETWETLCGPAGDDEAGRARGEWTPFGDALAIYDYVDEAGERLFQVVRCPGKKFVQRRPDPTHKSGWAWRLDGTRRVLYRLPKIIQAVSEGQIVYVVEGEKDVHSLEARGRVATCNPMGAGKWRPEFAEVLRDAVVVVVADRDDPGYAHARHVCATLQGVAAAVEMAEPAAGKDVTDHLEAGLDVAQLRVIWTDDQPHPDLAPSLLEFVAEVDPPLVFALGDLLEMGDKFMLTGLEGLGKTHLMRQIGVCAAVGLHPFTGVRIPRRRVMHLDFENQENRSRREYRPLVRRAAELGHPLDEDHFRILHRPRGIDLSDEAGRAWLAERVRGHEPEILMMGTLWKMSHADLNEERNAREVTDAIDEALAIGPCAAIIECHSPHGANPRDRPTRPAGSRALTAWPDVGLSLQPDAKADPDEPGRMRLKRWRGVRDRAQRWPRTLIPGIAGGFPFIAEAEPDTLT